MVHKIMNATLIPLPPLGHIPYDLVISDIITYFLIILHV